LKKAYKKEFNEDVFKVKYFFFVGNKKAVNKYLKKKFKDRDGLGKSAAEAFHYTYENGGVVQCLWLPSDKEVGYLVHEITHCVINVLERKGQSISRDTGETAAYLAEYLYNQFVSKKKWKRI
jgi:hypothetical protein